MFKHRHQADHIKKRINALIYTTYNTFIHNCKSKISWSYIITMDRRYPQIYTAEEGIKVYIFRAGAKTVP